MPALNLRWLHTRGPGFLQEAADSQGCLAQMMLCHQVGIDGVVGQRALFIGAGHIIDTDATLCVMRARRTPQAGRFDQQLKPTLFFPCHAASAADRGRDRIDTLGVDMECGCPGWPGM